MTFFVVFNFASMPNMSASGLWINAVWILLFAIFDVALSNYSEDQCSWRGRQVFLLFLNEKMVFQHH